VAEETQVVRPLTAEEIKDAIAQTIAERVRECLNTTCWLYGRAWPKFKVDGRLNITLANMYDEEQETHVDVRMMPHEVRDTEELPVPTGAFTPSDGQLRELTIDVDIPYTPPNVVRKRHGMPIPTVVKRDDGSTEQKAVVFRQTRGRRGHIPDAG
jgi:hypothetical protein